MKVTLKVADRIIVPLALRYLKNGGYAKFVTAKAIQQKVELTPEELEQYDVRDRADGFTTFNARKDTGREFEFSERETALMREALERMDERKALCWEFIPLFETFVPPATEPDGKRSDISGKIPDISGEMSDISNKMSDVSEEIPKQI